jgi:hypothetical protein
MKNKIRVFLIILLLLGSLFLFLNISVTTNKGKDFVVTRSELPLYLKLLGFYDRHFNYKWLVKQITGHLDTHEEKVFRLLQWTHENIRPQPKNLPIMDSHVWDVYIRGYGVSDNFHDLFSTLCNYSGVDAFYDRLMFEDSRKYIDITFVRVERGWVAFDPFKGAYFKNKDGHWATIEEMKQGDWELVKLPKSEVKESYYKPFVGLIPEITAIGYKRSNTQSPANRLKLQLSLFFSGQKVLLE